MRRATFTSLALLSCVTWSTAAGAQTLQPPPRSTTGLFGGGRAVPADRASHEFSLTGDVLGGYEDNLTPEGEVSADPLAIRQGGASALLGTALRYRYGRPSQYVEVNSRGFRRSITNLEVRPMYGGAADVRVGTRVADRATFTATGAVQYQPTFQLGTIGLGAPGLQSGAVAPTDPSLGVREVSSVSGDGSGAVDMSWSTRQQTSGMFAYTRRVVRADTDVDERNRIASVSHTWDAWRSVGLLTSYEYSRQLAEQELGDVLPVKSHAGLLGVRIRKRVSPTRNITFTVGGGGIRIDTLTALDRRPMQYTAPSGYGSARMDLGRTWSVSADFRRDVSVLDGVAQQSFLTDAVSLWVGGNVGPSWILSVTGSLNDGRPHEGDDGSFHGRGAIAQVRYSASRCCSVLGSYSYYEHRLRDLSALPAGVPSRFEQNAVRLGMTVWLPLFGRFPDSRRPAGRN